MDDDDEDLEVDEFGEQGSFNPYDIAKPIDLARTSDFEGFDEAANDLAGKLPIVGKPNLIEKHVRMWLVQLSRCHRWDPEGYLAFSRNNNSWVSRSTTKETMRGKAQLTPQGGLALNPLGYSSMAIGVIDALEVDGFVEGRKGFIDRESGKSRNSRTKATDKLIDDYLKPYDLMTAVTKRHDKAPLVILKDKNKNPIHFKKTAKTRKMEDGIKAYNQLLRNTDISLPDSSSSGLYLDQQQVHRVFNNNTFKKGGRYTGTWWMMGCNRNQRKDITINREATVELDYKAQHIYMLYGLKGVSYLEEYPKGDPYYDPYCLGDDCPHDRKIIKPSVLMGINATDGILSAWQALKQEQWREWHKAIKARKSAGLPVQDFEFFPYLDYINLMEWFEARHPLLIDDLFSGIGTKLMNIDSMVAEIIINHLTSQNIPVLGVHDSFIVRERDREVLQSIMETAYEKAGVGLYQSPVEVK